ncbi:DedA family protein [Helicobacter burdigaliensis]|uniref:DedA family protein n=1 Tax=Helicobacter burdigaliensis TaxID=2315334 RepID=UPI000EF6A0DD|nr:DedA family protein [Helicobacter burdigaliensis]
MSSIIDFIVNLVSDLGYFGIFFMMFLESSFIPFPSEVVMIPAGYLAHKGEMNLFWAIFSGVLGSLVGALLNYFLALFLGRAFLIRYGRYFFFTEETMQKMETFFKKHGHISTFSGRLVPVVRQYISLPAGIAKMNLSLFCFYTTLGAGIWVVILAILGYFLGQNEELIKEYLHLITLGLLVCIAILVGFYILWKRHTKTL